LIFCSNADGDQKSKIGGLNGPSLGFAPEVSHDIFLDSSSS